jgi:hypothetical protein
MQIEGQVRAITRALVGALGDTAANLVAMAVRGEKLPNVVNGVQPRN